MTHWTDTATTAHASIADALAAVDNILSFAKEERGKPTEAERALFAAAVVFIYGIWENYVEQLAVELVSNASAEVTPEKVPEQVRKSLEKKTAWELTVSPGWRALWAEHVKVQAVGDDAEKFGLNTAKAGQVQNLLVQAGVKEPYKDVPTTIVPKHLAAGQKDFVNAVNALVALRGEIVHTGKVPDSLRKGHVLQWRRFVEQAAKSIDETCRKQCHSLIC
jgi:RiboL-PSP-HEPN